MLGNEPKTGRPPANDLMPSPIVPLNLSFPLLFSFEWDRALLRGGQRERSNTTMANQRSEKLYRINIKIMTGK
jgi:hypothetical protein